jgi:preprotein translocase subunit SecY
MIDASHQPDVRNKLLFTFAMLVVFRFVAHVPVPNVDLDQLEAAFEGGTGDVLEFLNLFSGGALRNLSVAALGVYPYITASIIMQIMTPLNSRLRSLQEEGESGRRRIQVYTHWLAVPLAVVQGYGQLLLLEQAGAVSGVGLAGDDLLPTLAMLASFAAGTMFLVWIGELITEHGIGNGLSIIIFGGIVASMPEAINTVFNSSFGFGGIVLLLAIVVLVIVSIVFVQEGQRRIPVQYARSLFRGGRMYRQSGASHIPLRVNSAGMIPLIFAFSIMIFPSVVASYFENSGTEWVQNIAEFIRRITEPTNALYWIIVFVMVIIFTFFYTMVQYQQQRLAENLQKQGAFIPGIRPGRPTAEYLLRVVTRITWGGAIFLGIMAVLPYIATELTDVRALTISSTGMLIVVAVVIDTMRQLEAQLMMRNYEGFIR